MTISPEFFSTSAQIIPTIAIALIVEDRLFVAPALDKNGRDNSVERRRSVFAVMVGMFAAVLGEFFALLALLSEPFGLLAVGVIASLGTLSVLLVLPFIRTTKEVLFDDPDPDAFKLNRVNVAAYACVVVTVAAVVVSVLAVITLSAAG